MRVLQVTHHFHPCIGGIENYVLELCRHLKKQGIESDVLCLNKNPALNETLPERETFEGIKIQRVGFWNFKYYKIAPKGLLEIIKDYDLLHVHNIGWFSDFYAWMKFNHKKPLIISTHGGFFHTSSISIVKKLYFWIFNALAFSAFDAVICDSEHDFKLFSKISKKTVLVSNGVGVEKFLKLKGSREKNSMLFVGRFSKNKRIEDLLSVAALLKKQGLKFKLKILGNDFEGLLPEFKKTVEKQSLSDNVQIITGVSDPELKKAYSKAEFFVSASEYEGFGISAIEAMAAGCIPILNDIDSFNQFVKDGNNGFIADFARHEKTAEKISKILCLKASEKSRLLKAAREKAKEFDWRNVVKKVIKVYKGVLD